MVDLTKPPLDKVSHILIGVAAWLPFWLAGSPMEGFWANVFGWYMHEQAQEWHMCQRCKEAYFPWLWRRDSIDAAAWPIVVVGILTLLAW